MALSWLWSPIGTTASVPCAASCCRGRGREGKGKGGQFCPEISRGGFQDSCASSIGTGCRRAFADRRTSPNISHTRSNVALGTTEFLFEVIKLNEEVASQEFPGIPLTSSSKSLEKAVKVFGAAEDSWLAWPKSTKEICKAECKNLETETQEGIRGSLLMARERVNSFWSRDPSVFGRDEHAVLNINTQSSREVFMDEGGVYSGGIVYMIPNLSRCIHHLHAVLSLPGVTSIDKESRPCKSGQLLGSKGGIKTDLVDNDDGENSGVLSRTTGSDEFYLQKPVMHVWNGYWVGPDYEDGWGFVEALVSPVDMGEPFCKT